ncbi:MAG: ceramidase domain-containing protein [Burkholderiales bacterium]
MDDIDLYCERLAPGLLGEPLNTLTNLFFLVAAFVLGRRLRDDQRARRDDWLLVALVALVGVGSFIFHAVATVRTSVLDKLFIAFFIWAFFQRYLVRVAGLGNLGATAGVLLFIAGSWGLGRVVPKEALNGSVLYLPAVLGLAGLAAWTVVLRRPGGNVFIAAFVSFLVAIGFRTVDLAVCDAFPLGTHFVWHSLNALVLFLCCTALRRASARG